MFPHIKKCSLVLKMQSDRHWFHFYVFGTVLTKKKIHYEDIFCHIGVFLIPDFYKYLR